MWYVCIWQITIIIHSYVDTFKSCIEVMVEWLIYIPLYQPMYIEMIIQPRRGQYNDE